MNKNILKITFTLLTLSAILVSCSTSNDSLSHFSKRKYLKRFKENKVKYDNEINKVESEYAYEEKKTTIKQNESSKPVSIDKTEETASTNNPSIINPSSSKSITYEKPVDKRVNINEPIEWNKYNHKLDFSTINSKTYQHNKAVDTSDPVMLILLVVLAFFISPLSVYLKDESASQNFVINLILWLLGQLLWWGFWGLGWLLLIAAFVHAILVIFDMI
ncbi:MAG: hypothetical protein Kow0079_12530 [Vicingaceae bacterium]